MSLINQDSIEFEGYALDRNRWTLHWRGEPIALSAKTFDLLLYFLEHPDEILSKDRLLTALWPNQIVEESNLTQQVFLLRKALSRHDSATKLIETVPGRGYRFAAEVQGQAPVDSVLTSGHRVIEETPEDRASPPRRDSRGRGVTVIGMLSIAALLGAGSWLYVEHRSAAQPIAIVLADFNGAGDPASDQALNDALRIDLGQSPSLTVLSRGQVLETLQNMNRAADEPLDAAVAQEVCERNSAQVVLHGSASRFGRKYLVNVVATSCLAAADSLASAHETVDRPDDLPHAIDLIAETLRKSLGESRASIRRFDSPLLAVRTGSLEALKAYSEGTRLGGNGQPARSLALFHHALDLDPDFGAVYANIVAVYYNLQDTSALRQAIITAHQHRHSMSEKQRLSTEADYYEIIAGDPDKAVEIHQAQASLFPNDPVALTNLAATFSVIGRPTLGLDAARRGVALRPNSVAFNTLAAIEIATGMTQEAIAAVQGAIDMGVDTEDMHHCLLHAHYAEHDARGMQAQLAWSHQHPEQIKLRLDEVQLALVQGQRRKALQLYAQLHASGVSAEFQGESQAAVAEIARLLAETGLARESEALLKSVPAADEEKNARIARIEDGDFDTVPADLASVDGGYGSETLWKHEALPEIRAASLLANAKPQEALSALEPARRFDSVNFGPAFLRGKAYLQMGRATQALGEFRSITERIYADTLSTLYPLAVLESARAYEQSGDIGKSRQQYQHFLELWSDADDDLPLLLAARTEYRLLAQ